VAAPAASPWLLSPGGRRAVRVLPPTPEGVAGCIAEGNAVLSGVEIVEDGELVGYSPCIIVSANVVAGAVESFGAYVRTDEWSKRDVSPEQAENMIGFFFARA
jgi:hypothetical protein